MEELRHKGIADQLRIEEDRRRHEEEISLLKEQNKCLQQRLDGQEREDQSRASPTHQTHQTHPPILAHPTHHALQTHQTHQSSINNPIPDDEKDPREHPFIYDIIDTPLPAK